MQQVATGGLSEHDGLHQLHLSLLCPSLSWLLRRQESTTCYEPRNVHVWQPYRAFSPHNALWGRNHQH